MPLPRAVIFDLDETLTDRRLSIDKFAPLFSREFQSALAPCEMAEIVKCMCDADGNGYATREDLCRHLHRALRWNTAPGVEQLVKFWRDRFPACNVERQGATSTLRELRGRDVKLGLITNGSPTQWVKLEAMGIKSMFSVVIVSDEVGVKKPDARIFHMALSRLGVSASEAVFVGDNPELDIAGARAVGMRAIWLNAGNKSALNNVESINCLRELIPQIDG